MIRSQFDFKEQRDFDLHLALEVASESELEEMYAKGKNAGIHTRGISDHGFIKSIYFRDPNGCFACPATIPSPRLACFILVPITAVLETTACIGVPVCQVRGGADHTDRDEARRSRGARAGSQIS